ncbi:DEAD/DEAH box helicase [Chlamydia trachomatis]|uniref:SWI/SNF family helicase n=1 Tax=Chlamydia trachomatis serovar D (strain ATCC VR-885 / DSM 19411 / UW-3/Cx) TaxID=272561 RepID=O84559_CHLTR|nr:DEAD/DEAH box helicase [Chlamydia trachomatis]NP_220070.1 helicase [Chlamydia trachomatis D/UW-3/CX]AAC68157.1 SWI/SNF family helicase [Chlamydia trachomatis D/UW-3/CX]ADH19186.1 SWI/SNF family helicase [Chlamydia trachomatis G/11222]AGT70089.1 helicase [Chlamydia trachomatis]AKR32723.1 helicase [Chlamydia trachomatis D/CS637/11]AKR41596.1 helicase [Chlamydia trachomatis]
MILNSLSMFRHQATRFLQDNRDSIAVSFSKNTYKITIPDEDSPDGEWISTLSFNDEERLSFAACSCPDGDCCEHLLTATLAAYDPTEGALLHVKFKSSFWWGLFYQLFLSKAPLHAPGDKVYTIQSQQLSVSLQCLSAEALTYWLPIVHASPEPQTISKETFSQSALYRIARELFMFSQKGASLVIQENPQGFPSLFSLQWEGIALSIEVLDVDTLKALFPLLEFSQTSLYSGEPYLLHNVHVVPEQARIYFTKEYPPLPKSIKEYQETVLGPIKYFAEAKKCTSIPKTLSLPIHIIPALDRSFREHLLSQLCYETEERPIHYAIHFLRDASLSFSAYLETPGDLSEGHIIYPGFCYIPNKGLLAVSGLLSPESSFTIRSDHIENFLDEYGPFIKEPGFETFSNQSPVGSLSYNVTEQGVLLFHYDTGNAADIELRFGKWTYYSRQGFFLNSRLDLALQDGLTIEAPQVADFILTHEVALKSIPNFFAAQPPLKSIRFEVHKEKKGSGIYLQPIFEGLEHESCRLFGQFLYRENVGFSLLPAALQMLCQIPTEIPADQVAEFLLQFSKDDRMVFSDPQLALPERVELNILAIHRPHPSSPLHLKIEIKTNIGSIPLGTVLQALKGKKDFLFSKAGFLNLDNCLFVFLKQFLSSQRYDIQENTLITMVTDIFKLDALAPMITDPNIQASEEDLAYFSQLKSACLPPIPVNLFSTDHKLRPYQNSGLLWLWFLYNHRLSGLLCDEMGLGKTHQATALLDIVAQTAKNPKFLVVCPTSVLPHWEHVLASHLPQASLFSFHGPHKPKTLPDCDILITSYGTLRQNYALFYKVSFTVAVFDEIHTAKNKSSQIHKILCRLDAQMKLGLTGTPVENNLIEFKGLLDIILPNYLPSDALFKRLFTHKNASETDEDIISSKDLLLKLTRPFILRRTKKLVLPELPEKVESLIPCRLSPEQSQLYSSTLKKEKCQIQQLEKEEDPASVNYLHVFALLNQLKQICDHPAVYFKDPESYKNHSSGKWAAFVKLLNDSLASGYKVVVFSQYIQMIRIIALYLEEHAIEYALVQGKSQNRKEEIDRFSNDPNCRVFIGSLLAAGTGINLTAGNVVIMYDRWWNPAKENQALDRVHRIGQKNTVFIYKLVTEDTLEEHIHYLIEKKMRLLNQVTTTQDSNILHVLNREDLITILSYKDEHMLSEEVQEDSGDS